MKRRTLILVGLAVAVLIGFYIHGSFDRPLSSIGLNFHECARNGFGATFCGSELNQYRERVQRAKEGVERVKVSLAESERKSHEEQAEPERTQAAEASQRQVERIHTLESKMKSERAIIDSEPSGSASRDLAEAEYEGARAELQQIVAEAKSEQGK